MTDEAAESRRPTTPESATPSSPPPDPAPSAPHARAPGDSDPTITMPAGPAPDGPGGRPSSGPGTPPPPGGYPPPFRDRPADPPPAAGAGFTSRYGLVRPRQGRYLAGVCAAIGRATNTDPILWRVLLAVLGFFGGIGILVYLAAWLIIPAEGDTASPVEAMLGRGRSSMSPVTVLALGILAAVMFGLIVTDKFRAVLLGAAILIAGALLLNRNGGARSHGPAPMTPFGAPPPPGAAPAAAPATATRPFPAADAPFPPAAGVGAPYPGVKPGGPYPGAAHPAGPPPLDRGYRPAFAPRGPYSGTGPYPPGAVPEPPKPPKPPKERSALGAATFSMIFVAIGGVVILDLTNAVPVAPSAYFAAVLVTVALGLLVGAWFGRARWLIALGLAASAALGISTVAESYNRVNSFADDVVWEPASYGAMADRYANTFGGAVLDLRKVDFAGHDAEVSVEVNFGKLRVLVPPSVDVTASADASAGDVRVFDTHWSGIDRRPREVTDLGADGPGGGKLRLNLHVNAGDLEVTR